MSPAPKRGQTAAPKPDPPDSEPILSLSTAAPVRPTVAIDGRPYEMALMGDFGIIEQQILAREGAEFQKLWQRDKLTKSQQERLRQLLDAQFAKLLLDVPDDAAAGLNDEARAQVVLAFMLEPLRKAQREAAEQQDRARGLAEWLADLLERDLTPEEDAELTVLLDEAAIKKAEKTT